MNPGLESNGFSSKLSLLSQISAVSQCLKTECVPAVPRERFIDPCSVSTTEHCFCADQYQGPTLRLVYPNGSTRRCKPSPCLNLTRAFRGHRNKGHVFHQCIAQRILAHHIPAILTSLGGTFILTSVKSFAAPPYHHVPFCSLPLTNGSGILSRVTPTSDKLQPCM